MNLYKYYNNPEQLYNYKICSASDPKLAYDYATRYNRPFPEGEDAIAKSAYFSYRYAIDVLKGPFLKGEDRITTDANYSYLYAYYILKGPFKKGEDRIATDAQYSYLYAIHVLNGPFKKGEDAIATDRFYWDSYKHFFVGN
ncbi:MAG: hypothetical protein ACXW2E_00020 [Nitrososphaeraceae archaeon]